MKRPETEKARGREEAKRQNELAASAELDLLLSLRVVYLHCSTVYIGCVLLADQMLLKLDGSLDKERCIYRSKDYRVGLSLTSVLPLVSCKLYTWTSTGIY